MPLEIYKGSKTPESARDKRATPWEVFRKAAEQLNMPIVWDVCAEVNTVKTTFEGPLLHWSADDDALTQDWAATLRLMISEFCCGPAAMWMNPPYSKPGPWVQKAYEESQKGAIIMGLLGDDRSTSWYQDWIEDKAPLVFIPDRRIAFCDETGKPQPGNPMGSVFPVWMPMRANKTQYIRFKL